MDNVKLSVCIPTYKRAGILRGTLAHLAGCGIAMEVVVTDNDSPDETAEVVKGFEGRFAGLTYFRQAENRGPQENCATSLRIATGAYVYTLSDDDRVIPQGLTAAIGVLDHEADVVAVYGGYQEWDPATDQVLSTNLHVQERKTYDKTQKAQLVNDYALLWCPLARRETVQRFCSYDKRSFGLMRFAGQLMNHGKVAVVPDLMYQHAHTPERLENQLTESWYHDAYRADYELFLAEAIAQPDGAQVGHFIGMRAAQGYLQAIRFATKQKQYVTAQQFVLRAKAYGLLTADAVAKWERDNLYFVLADRVMELVRGVPGVEQVLMEDCEEGRKCAEAMDGVRVELVGVEALVECDADNGVMVLSREYATLERRTERDPLRERALMDLLVGCRVT